MTITGKKIVVLSKEERQLLDTTINLLNALNEAVGNDNSYVDFEDVSAALYYIKNTNKFEIDFEQ